ncbi:multiple sugar transport system substrate-binding protein [Catenuloplanes nepalensis]|uniref:Multiple sugar transport system substrate-binding protein n=1 Tax=Catenuloplanes nepalensis TaxID=587533 RepID=A0ABT9MYV8_9ACTN|nr:extracellular solute-binding protein [Catenuloplanes nepalensis]MDP9796631.1 multiple sugar transport system substrate-binding protein [Catenuloplanes nepalensis]
MGDRGVRRGIVAVLVAVLAAGCGGVGGDDGGAGGAVTLTMMGFGTGDEIARTRFDAANARIAPGTAVASEGSFDAQQFLSAVASGTPPDLVYMERRLLGTYAAKGALLPLRDCVARERIDVAQFRPAALAEATLRGELYGLPDFYNNRVLMINDAVVGEAGLATDDWDALAKRAEELTVTEAGKLSRIGFDPKIPEFLPMWARANGAELVSADGRTARLDDPRVAEALEFTAGLIRAQGGWAAFKSFRDTFDFFGARNQFASGQLGAFVMEDFYLNVLAENSPDTAVTVAPFRGRDGKPVDWITGNAWAIPKGGPHPEEACRWIATMTDSETWIAAARARAKVRADAGKPYAGTFTGNVRADEVIFRDVVQPSAAVRTVLETQETGFSLPAMAAGEEFKAAWQDAVNRVLDGRQSPAEALAQAQRQAQAALDEANRGS